MKTEQTSKALTLGELIENFQNAYGKPPGQDFLRHLVKAHLVGFRGIHRYVSSAGK
jgi:hypothetical protein